MKRPPLAFLIGLAPAAFAALAGQPACAADAPAAARPPIPAGGELGFILSNFSPAVYHGEDDCPDGLAGTVKENFLATLSPAERDRLKQPENEKEFLAGWRASIRGPGNANICVNPEMFSRPVQRTVQGKVAIGLDLDGGGESGGCAHESFTSPTGETGIDNQLYRAQGCNVSYRGTDGVSGDAVKQADKFLVTGEHGTVLLLRGVDSLENDDSVEVILASTRDKPALDSKSNFISGASYTITDNPRWRNVTRGRIVEGVLFTEPMNVALNSAYGFGGQRGTKSERLYQAGRFRLSFEPDGSVRGLFGGYQPLQNTVEALRVGGIGVAIDGQMDCAAILATSRSLADGMRDPKTGQCTAISMANQTVGVPAFIFDRPPAGATGRERK